LLLFYSSKSFSLDSHCPMFSLISLNVLALRLALSYAVKVSVLRLADTQTASSSSSIILTSCPGSSFCPSQAATNQFILQSNPIS
jgi:hypothetical protein